MRQQANIMPIIKSAKKALRQSKRNRVENDARRKAFRRSVKDFKDKPTVGGLSSAFSFLDRAVDNNVIHRNKAARLKSGLAKRLLKRTSAA